MANHGAHVVLTGVTKTYGELTALSPTDLVIEPGEFFSLIGPSGSGKSTLLGAIAGFLAPTAGRIEIDGTDVVAVPPYRRNIGMVFQNYALFPHMSVFDNVAFPLRLRKRPAAEVSAAVDRMLETVRLTGLARRMPQQLSGGQQQRVALARAAVYDPRVLLMDEPLGALDKNLREEMQYEIRQFHAALGATIIYVTHDQDEAATMSTRVGIMKDGKLVQVGRPRELYEHPRNSFVAGFLGEANLLAVQSARATGNGTVTVATESGLTLTSRSPLPATGVQLTACIRPEHVHVVPPANVAATGVGGADSSVISGTIRDIVYTAGTVRYRIDCGAGVIVTAKIAARRDGEAFEVGQPVTIVCAAENTILVPRE